MSLPALAGLPIRRTSNIINPNTRICAMVYGPPKVGKTTMAATMHEWCMKEYGKPALVIPFEATDGGGVSAIQAFDVPWVQPTNLKETEAILRALQTDETYAAIIIDNLSDLVKNIIQPYALTFPSRENVPTRTAGVPERSDYQTIGEKTRSVLNLCIALTKSDPRYRKHLIVNALQEDHRDSSGNLDRVGPDLPGALAKSGPALFELLASIEVATKAVPSPDNPKQMVRQKVYTFNTSADGVRMSGDRYNVFPATAPANWNDLMDKYWKPKVMQNDGSITTQLPIAA